MRGHVNLVSHRDSSFSYCLEEFGQKVPIPALEMRAPRWIDATYIYTHAEFRSKNFIASFASTKIWNPLIFHEHKPSLAIWPEMRAAPNTGTGLL